MNSSETATYIIKNNHYMVLSTANAAAKPWASPLFYVYAEAVELADPGDIERAIKVLARRPQPDKFTTKSSADVTGNAASRIYKAIPKAIYIRADAIDAASGQAISVREPVTIT